MLGKSENRNNGLKNERSSKKHGHSKVGTPRASRHQGVCLSLDVATKFSILHDMLKFDNPSDTVEWLLRKTKYAIEELEAARANGSEMRRSTATASSSSQSVVEKEWSEKRKRKGKAQGKDEISDDDDVDVDEDEEMTTAS